MLPYDTSKLELKTLFFKIKRVSDYAKLKELHTSMSNQIEELNEIVHNHTPARNPRINMIQTNEKTNLFGLQKQKLRIEQKMIELEKLIKLDIECIS